MKKKKEVGIIRMYIAPPISNLVISEHGQRFLNENDLKLIKGAAHSLFKKICNCTTSEHV